MDSIVAELDTTLHAKLEPLFQEQHEEQVLEQEHTMLMLKQREQQTPRKSSDLPSIVCLFLGLCGGIVLNSMSTVRP